jgi:hypothetical protein
MHAHYGHALLRRMQPHLLARHHPQRFWEV